MGRPESRRSPCSGASLAWISPRRWQYVDWMKGVLRVRPRDIDHPPYECDQGNIRIAAKTFYLGSIAFLLSVIIGNSRRRDLCCETGSVDRYGHDRLCKYRDHGSYFLLGILMIYLFGLELDWLPIFGYTSPSMIFG